VLPNTTMVSDRLLLHQQFRFPVIELQAQAHFLALEKIASRSARR
jgi:hypothetical protein